MRLRDELLELSNDIQKFNKKLTAIRNRCRNSTYRFTDMVEATPQMIEDLFLDQSSATISVCLLLETLRKLEDTE